jgi:hypothetical protein
MAIHAKHGKRSLCGVRAEEIRIAGLSKDCAKKHLLVWRVVDNKNAHVDTSPALAQRCVSNYLVV